MTSNPIDEKGRDYPPGMRDSDWYHVDGPESREPTGKTCSHNTHGWPTYVDCGKPITRYSYHGEVWDQCEVGHENCIDKRERLTGYGTNP